LYLFDIEGIRGIDWSSILFTISGLIFIVALYDTRFLDLVPIARDKLVNSLRDGMIVLDSQNRILEINQEAIDIIDSSQKKLIGESIADNLPS